MCYNNKQIRVVACCPVEGASRFKCFNSSADQRVDTCHIDICIRAVRDNDNMAAGGEGCLLTQNSDRLYHILAAKAA